MGKFRIKISPASWSRDFIILKYSTNGIFWKTIKECEYDILDEWCYMVPKIHNFKNAEYLLEKFKSLDNVLRFESEELLKVINHNKDITERKRRHEKEREDVYRRFS